MHDRFSNQLQKALERISRENFGIDIDLLRRAARYGFADEIHTLIKSRFQGHANFEKI